MHERGVQATGIDEVLAACRCGKSQFYHYFQSKDDLLAAVLEYQLESVLGELEDLRLDTWRGLRAWFDRLVARQERRGFRGCPVGSLAVELSASTPGLQGLVAEAFARWETVLADAFASMKRKGSLGPDAQPALLAEAVLVAIQGGYLLSTARLDARPMRTALDAAYEQLRASR